MHDPDDLLYFVLLYDMFLVYNYYNIRYWQLFYLFSDGFIAWRYYRTTTPRKVSCAIGTSGDSFMPFSH